MNSGKRKRRAENLRPERLEAGMPGELHDVAPDVERERRRLPHDAVDAVEPRRVLAVLDQDGQDVVDEPNGAVRVDARYRESTRAREREYGACQPLVASPEASLRDLAPVEGSALTGARLESGDERRQPLRRERIPRHA